MTFVGAVAPVCATRRAANSSKSSFFSAMRRSKPPNDILAANRNCEMPLTTRSVWTSSDGHSTTTRLSHKRYLRLPTGCFRAARSGSGERKGSSAGPVAAWPLDVLGFEAPRPSEGCRSARLVTAVQRRYDAGMTRSKIAISLPRDQLARVHREVRAGRADSVSGYISHVLAEHGKRESLRVLLRDLINQYGEPAAKDVKWAERVLAPRRG